jgi:excisionase family DNA binding protein
MIFTLRTAAQHTGTSKSTILRAIKSGRLSATRLEDGSYEIDAAELERVYPAERMKRRNTDAMEHHAPGFSAEGNTSAPSATAATLEAEIAGLREILRRADAAADELRQERDRWRNMAENAQRLLADQRPRSWWQRLTG